MFGFGKGKGKQPPQAEQDPQEQLPAPEAAAPAEAEPAPKPARGGLFSRFLRPEQKTPRTEAEKTPPDALPEEALQPVEAREEPPADQAPEVALPPVAPEGPPPVVEPAPAVAALSQPPPAEKPAKGGLFSRLKQGLAKTRSQFAEGLGNLFLGKKEIDDDLLEELETRLITADVGVEATSAIIGDLTRRVSRKQLDDVDALMGALRENLRTILDPVEQPLEIPAQVRPYVILMVGINGAGKTTTIGKIARKLKDSGLSVMLAAGDTFRAAAVEQLQVWGERNQVPVIAQGSGADSASVVFDAVQAARARGIDVVIADTAGRLHTQSNLMEELKKVKRVVGKLDERAPHEVLLVLDSGTGQNAINQAKQFHEAVGVSGLVMTKLDGTAKGGVIFAVAKRMGLPIRFIGVGEGIDDLRVFRSEEFVNALLER